MVEHGDGVAPRRRQPSAITGFEVVDEEALQRSADEAAAFVAAAERAAAEANERIARCHEVVACPRCRAPVGRRCAAMRGYGGGGYAELTVKAGLKPAATSYVRMGRELKHPHRERWTLVQAPR